MSVQGYVTVRQYGGQSLDCTVSQSLISVQAYEVIEQIVDNHYIVWWYYRMI
jgi:hypothetical protein